MLMARRLIIPAALFYTKKGSDCTTAVAFLFIWDSLFDFSCFYDEFYAAGAAGGEAGEGLVVLAGLLDGFQAAHCIAQAAAKGLFDLIQFKKHRDAPLLVSVC